MGIKVKKIFFFFLSVIWDWLIKRSCCIRQSLLRFLAALVGLGVSSMQLKSGDCVPGIK